MPEAERHSCGKRMNSKPKTSAAMWWAERRGSSYDKLKCTKGDVYPFWRVPFAEKPVS